MATTSTSKMSSPSALFPEMVKRMQEEKQQRERHLPDVQKIRDEVKQKRFQAVHGGHEADYFGFHDDFFIAYQEHLEDLFRGKSELEGKSEDWRHTMEEIVALRFVLDFLRRAIRAGVNTRGSTRYDWARDETRNSDLLKGLITLRSTDLEVDFDIYKRNESSDVEFSTVSAIGRASSPLREEVIVAAVIESCRIFEQYINDVVARSFAVNRTVIEAIYYLWLVPANAELLKFDFRNGPLRKKYDGMKYIVKGVEETLYQLSLGEQNSENAPLEPVPGALLAESNEMPENPLDHLRSVFEGYDAVRDEVIKSSRDVTKASKQAIYSVHRGQIAEAEKQIAIATKAAQGILDKNIFISSSTTTSSSGGQLTGEPPAAKKTKTASTSATSSGATAPSSTTTTTSCSASSSTTYPSSKTRYPSLRTCPAFSQALEELGEAHVFCHWIKTKELKRHPLLSDEEFIGALGDLSGELQRYAVAQATKRDQSAVKEILDLQTQLNRLFMELGSSKTASTIARKKTAAAIAGRAKAEQLMFQLHLSKALHTRVDVNAGGGAPSRALDGSGAFRDQDEE
ncbi:unnamed protein product [Amoebophrya sp. A25]|nr:unnamed protein product [Amoebophrya sp. A25]|eukprot:GSA25T00022326001.1